MNGKQVVVLVLCACAYFFCILNRTCLAVMFDELAATFRCPVHEIGFCGGSFFLACAASQPLAQAITLKFDVGILLGLSMLLATIGSLGFAFSRSLAAACVTRAITGLGVGPVSLLLGELMRGWFPRRTFVAVSGLMMYAGSLGAIIAQGPLSSFLYKFDWQIAFYVISGFTGAIGALLLLLARGRIVKINLEGSNFGVLGDSLLVEEVKTSPFSTSFIATRQFWMLMGYFACVPSDRVDWNALGGSASEQCCCSFLRVFLRVRCIGPGPGSSVIAQRYGLKCSLGRVRGYVHLLFDWSPADAWCWRHEGYVQKLR